jgi:Tol biopolymer transport system component
VSVDSSGAQAGGGGEPAISADGRFVAFASGATDLVAGDTNGAPDIFVRDRSTGTTERVSVDSTGAEADNFSDLPTITPDGRFVAFMSFADNLVPGDTNQAGDVFVHDRSTRITERVSVDSTGAEGDDNSSSLALPSISADGMVIAFHSYARNLVTGDTNGSQDVFVHDRSTGITERVSVDSNGTQGNNQSYFPALSSDGGLVAFISGASNLVASDTNRSFDVFVHDRTTGGTERVSVSSTGAQGDDSSYFPALTPDGRFVTFFSGATKLVAGDTNGFFDVFVRDRVAGTTERVSVDSAGVQGNGDCGPLDFLSISADGQTVAFSSDATNLVTADTNGCTDVFVHQKCSTPASWSNYGYGFPGTNGVPSFTCQQNPVFGTTITLDVSNSYAHPTVGVVFVGFQRTSLHSNWGGDLLVAPTLTLFVTFSYGGDSFTGTIPDDRTLCGLAIDLQAIEADPGAAHGVSFTPGLELVLGR